MKKTSCNYQDLQCSIDALIGKFGLEKTINIVDTLKNNTQLSAKDNHKEKLLLVYVVSRSIEVFNLEEANFYTSPINEYREARMACYFLVKKYTENSFGIIGEHFKQSKRAVMYHYHKCDEILSIPQYYKSFVSQFKVLEDGVINFLAKLN